MARKKVKLAWIQNDAARRATFKKRRKGLMKKVSELSVLCDVKACAIVYAPNEPNPEVWPSVQEATRVLHRFRSMPEMEQSRKMMNQEGFLRDRIFKAEAQWKKLCNETRDSEYAALMFDCFSGRALHDLGSHEVSHLSWLLDSKLKAVNERIDALRSQPQEAPTSPIPLLTNTTTTTTTTTAADPSAANGAGAPAAVGTTSAPVAATLPTHRRQYHPHHQNQHHLHQYHQHNHYQNSAPVTAPMTNYMEGVVNQHQEMDHHQLDSSLEMMKRQEMFLQYNPHYYWPGGDQEQALLPYMDVGNNPVMHPYADHSQSNWLDNYFHT